MIYTPNNSQGLKLVDAMGREIVMAVTFNDETFEVESYIQVKELGGRPAIDDEGKIIKAKYIVKGAKMVSRKQDGN